MIPLPDDPRLLALVVEECARFLDHFDGLKVAARELADQLPDNRAGWEAAFRASRPLQIKLRAILERDAQPKPTLQTASRFLPVDWTDAAGNIDPARVMVWMREPGHATVNATLATVRDLLRAAMAKLSPPETPAQARDRFCAEQAAAGRDYAVIAKTANRQFPDLKPMNTATPGAAKMSVLRAIGRHRARRNAP